MSMDKSLKKGGGLVRARNVLTRAERMALLQEDEKWTPAHGVYNLPKTKFRRLAADKKTIQGKVHFVLPRKIGDTIVVSGVDEGLVLSAIQAALA